MSAMRQPLFRKRPASHGYGYDANGVAGWLVTIGFLVMLGATAIPMGLLAQRGDWPLSLPLGLVVMAEAAAFVWFARRESERA